MKTIKTVRPDKKGRITLGDLVRGASSVRVSVDEQERIILEPLVEVPAHEAWLYRNPEALLRVEKGLDDVRAGRLYDLGSFAAEGPDDA